MLSYLSLMRPANCLMSALAVFIGGLVILNVGIVTFPQILIAMLVAFLITGAGNGINDCCDVEADRVNKPKRPIPSGKITYRRAMIFTISLFAIGILLSGFLNTLAFLIAIVNSILLVAYPLWLQNRILIGNIVVSYLVGSTFLFGGVAASSSITQIALTGLLLLLAFFANLAREIVKDMEDIEGDRTSLLKRLTGKAKSSSMGNRLDISSMEPTVKHKKALLILAQMSLLLAIIVSPLPYLLGILGSAYLVFLVPTIFFFLLSILLLHSKEDSIVKKARALLFGKKLYRTVSKYIKFGMLFGLLSFIAGALI